MYISNIIPSKYVRQRGAASGMPNSNRALAFITNLNYLFIF